MCSVCHDRLARIYLFRVRPFVSMLIFDVPPQQTHFSEHGGALQVRTREGCYCLHLFFPVDRFTKLLSISKSLYYMNSRCYQIRGNCFAHRTHVGSRLRRDVQLQSMRALPKQGAHFMRHLCCDSKSSVCFSPSTNICAGTFCAFLSQEPRRGVLGAFLVAGWLCSSILLEPRSGQVRRKIRHAEKLSQSPFQFAHKTATFVKFLQSFDAISKLFCLWCGVSCQFPLLRHARILVQTCLPEKQLPTFAGEENRPSEFAPPFFCPAFSTNSELHCRRHCSKFSVNLFVQDLSSFFRCPSASSSLQEVGLSVCSAIEFILCEASFHSVLQKRINEPERTPPCTVALNTLHVNLKLTCAVQKSPSMCHAFQAAAIRVSLSLTNDMLQDNLRPRCLAVVNSQH